MDSARWALRVWCKGKVIAIVDYGVGNLGSVANMIRHVGGASSITADPDEIRAARKIVLPGVGHFKNGMQELRARQIIEALNQARNSGAWILGICLGMQLMTRHSEEGDCLGLGWFDLKTRRFPHEKIDGKPLIIPHMGWNTVHVIDEGCPLLPPSEDGSRFYFVNSYYVERNASQQSVCTTTYGSTEFASGIAAGRTFGFQFHPEKSHKYGKRLMQKFVDLQDD